MTFPPPGSLVISGLSSRARFSSRRPMRASTFASLRAVQDQAQGITARQGHYGLILALHGQHTAFVIHPAWGQAHDEGRARAGRLGYKV